MWYAGLLLAAAVAFSPGQAPADEEPAKPAFEDGMSVLATAYTSGPESTGKVPGDPAYGLTFSGVPAREGDYGTIAVDPKVIPLGSLVYIEELDEYRVAEDTGAAIAGNKIDVYMSKVPDALQWGVRKVRIRVFRPV